MEMLTNPQSTDYVMSSYTDIKAGGKITLDVNSGLDYAAKNGKDRFLVLVYNNSASAGGLHFEPNNNKIENYANVIYTNGSSLSNDTKTTVWYIFIAIVIISIITYSVRTYYCSVI